MSFKKERAAGIKKIDILIPSFDDLGAQRVAINVANGLKNDYLINFVVFEKSGPFIDYLDKGIKVVALNDSIPDIPKIRVFLRAYAYHRHARRNKTEIAISFSPITNFVILVAKLFNKNLKTVIQAHDFPSLFTKDRENVGLLGAITLKNFLFKLYNKSDIFLTIAEAIKNDYIENFGVRSDFWKIVRNPVDIEKTVEMAKEKVDDFNFEVSKKYLIGVGRLAEQKNFGRLIDVFKIVIEKDSSTELIILGSGSLEKKLRQHATSLQLENLVHFIGFKNNPYKYISRADCFCLTSNWEGLPQVVAEAMICKTVVVANDCQSGPAEMIKNGETGFVVEYENLEDFATTVTSLIRDKQETKRVEEKAFGFASEEYSIPKCLKAYKEIINELS